MKKITVLQGHIMNKVRIFILAVFSLLGLISASLADLSKFVHGYKFQDCDGCPEMVVVRGGAFMMGSPSDEKGRTNFEGPQHQVNVPDFAVGQFEVTYGQFHKFVSETGYRTANKCWIYDNPKLKMKSGHSYTNPGYAQKDNHPVVCVSWLDAKAYVKWLGRKSGKSYRLLSEAEWEYAARAGSATPYFFGSDEGKLCEYANGPDKSTSFSWRNKACDDGSSRVATVGSYKSNNFGLYDVHGNVWEWVEDYWHETYKDAPVDGSAWGRSSDSETASHVLRGADWLHGADVQRSAYRHYNTPSYRDNLTGFRVARGL